MFNPLNLLAGGWLRLMPYIAIAALSLAIWIGWGVHKHDLAQLETAKAVTADVLAENKHFVDANKMVAANQARNDAALREIHIQTIERIKWLTETKDRTDAIAKTDDISLCAPGIGVAIKRMRERQAGDLQPASDTPHGAK